MNEIKFCAFADLHEATNYYNNAPDRLAAIRRHAEEEQVDMVLHCGDLCHGPTLTPDIVKQCDAFPMPLYHSIGNHDCDGSTYAEVLAAYHMTNGYYYVDVKGFRFIAYDANQMDHHGEILHYDMRNYWHPPVGIREDSTLMDVLGQEQLTWLEQTIMDSPYPCVLFGHHSLVRTKSALRAEERKQVRALMRRVNKDKQRVLLVICGHYHVDFLSFHDNVPYFELNSASNYYFGPTHQSFPEEIHKNYPGTAHNLIWNDALHAIITLRDDGHVHIKGMESSCFCDVTMESLGLPIQDASSRVITPDVMTTSFQVDMRGLNNL